MIVDDDVDDDDVDDDDDDDDDHGDGDNDAEEKEHCGTAVTAARRGRSVHFQSLGLLSMIKAPQDAPENLMWPAACLIKEALVS